MSECEIVAKHEREIVARYIHVHVWCVDLSLALSNWTHTHTHTRTHTVTYTLLNLSVLSCNNGPGDIIIMPYYITCHIIE